MKMPIGNNRSYEPRRVKEHRAWHRLNHSVWETEKGHTAMTVLITSLTVLLVTVLWANI